VKIKDYRKREHMVKEKIGVLLINLGTPGGPDKTSVKRYLKQFLDDPRVIDLPWLIRKALLHLFILPFRPAKTAKAYAAIWDQKGSPLLLHSMHLATELQQTLGKDYQVEVGMRYGKPSIPSAIDKLLAAKCHNIIVLAMFPQYSSAANGSALENVMQYFDAKWNIPGLKILPAFYRDPGYIEAQAKLIQPYLNKNPNQKILFSYHSLPARHIEKSQGCATSCAMTAPCPAVAGDSTFCYRAQCYETSHLLAQKLQLSDSQYTVAFQSRLGRTVWVGPDIQSVMPQLIKQGTKDLLVACPSFVADCLETLEEIGIRAKEEWLRLGGDTFTLVPCLNAEPMWVQTVADLVRQ